jgi:hypothetical protein
LRSAQVEAFSLRLQQGLSEGGHVSAALKPETPLCDLPYELGSQCSFCPRAEACWADAAARDALQLSGCDGRTAQQLAEGGVKDIEDLAQLAGVALHEPQQLASRAEKLKVPFKDLQSLALRASARARRGWGQPSVPTLLPGAVPSRLPAIDPAVPYLRAYLVVWTSALPQGSGPQRVVGLAYHVAAGRRDGAKRCTPAQQQQAGVDGHFLLQPPQGWNSSAGCTALDWANKETNLLTDFANNLRESMGELAGATEAFLHMYAHSARELQALAARCAPLDGPAHGKLTWLLHLLGLRKQLPGEQVRGCQRMGPVGLLARCCLQLAASGSGVCQDIAL